MLRARSLLRPWTLVLAVLVAVATLFAVRTFSGTEVRTARVTRGDLIQSVVATGRIIAQSRVEIGTQIAGVVDRVNVREGDRVTAGTVLATLQDAEQEAAVEQARAALDEAKARLAQLGITTLPVAEQQLRQADANLQLARSEHVRVTELHAAGFFSRARLDEARRNLESAEAQRRAALKQTEAARPKGSEASLAYAREAQARAALDAARSRLTHTRIVTPVAGVVLRRGAEPGDLVTAGGRLFNMGAGETQAQVFVDEKNLSFLAPGQEARILADAFPGRPFSGRVFHIAPNVDVQRGTVEVRLTLPEIPDFARIDMTVSVEIVAGRKSRALTLASDAVRDAAGSAPWALAVRAGRTVRVPLRLGSRGTGTVEVIDGLAEGESVVLASEPGIREGMSVRPRTP